MNPGTASLRCRCGAVRGVLSDIRPSRTNRLVCYCDDCQAFARWLAIDGVLDARGGTDIVQVAPSQLRFTQGIDRLRSMRLSDQGLFRWFTDCCRTPAGNMLYTPRSPFVGLPVGMLDRSDGRSVDALVGPAIGAIQGRFAIGGCPPGVHPSASFGVVARSASMLLRNLLARRYRPSPYFRDGQPIAAPLVLSAEERRAV